MPAPTFTERDPNSSYMMPAHFGPRPVSPRSSGWYRDVTAITVSYLTDKETLARYLPAHFEVAQEAVISVTYARNRDVDWLAGHGYNLIAVKAAVVHRGQETLHGTYTLVIWENLADPILTGRELQGIPKVFADIPDHTETDGRWHTDASHFGHKIVDIEAAALRAPTDAEIAAYAQGTPEPQHPMTWRFFPGMNGIGEDIRQYCTVPSEDHIEDVLVGEGRVNWQHLSWEQNPTQCHIVNALADLPILSYLPALVTRGSTNLILPERLPRVIR